MSRSRYEPVPQRDEVIILDSIQSNTHYNHNLQHSAPSIRSIPNSPPPSFHSMSSPGTPRPTTAREDYSELWGVASSTHGAPSMHGAQTEVCGGAEALAQITLLRTRVERLEESIGKLLLEREETDANVKYKGGSCCMSYMDASPALEQGMSAAGGNCCIQFNLSEDRESKRREMKVWFTIGITFLICATIVLSNFAKRKAQVTESGH